MSESENFNILEGENDLSISKEVCGTSAKISNNPKPKDIDEEVEEDIIYAEQKKQISPTNANVNKYNEKNKAKNNKEESDDDA